MHSPPPQADLIRCLRPSCPCPTATTAPLPRTRTPRPIRHPWMARIEWTCGAPPVGALPRRLSALLPPRTTTRLELSDELAITRWWWSQYCLLIFHTLLIVVPSLLSVLPNQCRCALTTCIHFNNCSSDFTRNQITVFNAFLSSITLYYCIVHFKVYIVIIFFVLIFVVSYASR